MDSKIPKELLEIYKTVLKYKHVPKYAFIDGILIVSVKSWMREYIVALCGDDVSIVIKDDYIPELNLQSELEYFTKKIYASMAIPSKYLQSQYKWTTVSSQQQMYGCQQNPLITAGLKGMIE